MPSIQIKGIDELIQRLDNVPKEIKSANKIALGATALFIRGQIEERWKVDTGFSRSRIDSEIDTGIDGTDLNVGFITKEVDYAWYVENGRRPGKFPPLDVITGWLGGKKALQQSMITRFFPNKAVPLIQRQSVYNKLTPQQKGLVFIIGRGMAKNGTKGAFAFRNVRERHLGEAEAIYLDKLTRELNL